MTRYPRDMQGYGGEPPAADWPGGARIAVQFVLNYEEGGENCMLHGDAASEAFLSEIVGAQPWPGKRHWNMESIYEYGARAGFWRLRDLFVVARRAGDGLWRRHGAGAVAGAGRGDAGGGVGDRQPRAEVDRLPRLHAPRRSAADIARGDPAAHRGDGGAAARLVHRALTSVNTVDLASEDRASSTGSRTPTTTTCPIGASIAGRQQLIIPYTLDANDMRFATPQGFNAGDQFFAYLQRQLRHALCRGRGGAARR